MRHLCHPPAHMRHISNPTFSRTSCTMQKVTKHLFESAQENRQRTRDTTSKGTLASIIAMAIQRLFLFIQTKFINVEIRHKFVLSLKKQISARNELS